MVQRPINARSAHIHPLGRRHLDMLKLRRDWLPTISHECVSSLIPLVSSSIRAIADGLGLSVVRSRRAGMGGRLGSAIFRSVLL